MLEGLESEKGAEGKRAEQKGTEKEEELSEAQEREKEEDLPKVSKMSEEVPKATKKETPTTFFQRFWPEFFWYKTTDTDTLWDISEHFYGHGRYYPVLMAMNPEVDIFEVKAGQQLKVLKDQGEVIKIYHQFVEKRNQVFYFWYQVREGDIPAGLSRKFYKTEEYYQLIQQVNPGFSLEPGQKIRIFLDEDR